MVPIETSAFMVSVMRSPRQDSTGNGSYRNFLRNCKEAMSEVYVHLDEQETTKKAPYLQSSWTLRT